MSFSGIKANALYDTVVIKEKIIKTRGTFLVSNSSVVFPEILAGNEAYTQDYIENFAVARRSYIIRMYSKGKIFFPKISVILKKHQLPEELQVLPVLESAFIATAVSKAGAVGYWQFMDAVAKEYGLAYIPAEKPEVKFRSTDSHKAALNKKNKSKVVKDDRTDFHKSTQAAARYLKDRARNLDNDILLMVASYNCGVGNVWEAMKKSGKAKPCFWDIKKYLPAETQAYVMNFISLNVVFHNYSAFLQYGIYFDAMPEPSGIADECDEAVTAPVMQQF